MFDGLDYDRLHYAEELIQDSRERWPWAWRGCVGAWAPSMGRTGSTLLDWSGRRNHGTLTNGPLWTPGRDGYLLTFDGVDDHVRVSTSPILQLGGSVMSLSAWVTPVFAEGVVQRVVYKSDDGTAANAFALAAERVDGQNRIHFSHRKSGVETNRFANVAGDVLYHVVGTFDGIDQVRLYINGSSVNSGNTVLGWSGSNQDLFIGQRSDGLAKFTGKLDDLRLYSRVLSPEESRELNRLGRGGLYRLPQRTMSYRARLPTFRPWRGRQNKLLGGGIV